MRSFPRLLLLAAAAMACSCVAYNEPCGGLVDNPTEVQGFLKGRVYLDKNNARHANNAIGRMAAEAFAEAFGDTGKPDLGILNGGAIRNEGGQAPNGQCLTRNVIGGGSGPAPVTNGDIHQIFLFENSVYAVDLTEREVFQVFEHSAAGLTAAPAAVVSPSGRFLQVAARHGTDVFIHVDCSKAPSEDNPGSGRVTEIRIGTRTLSPLVTDKYVRVAMPEFLLRGGDGYGVLAPLRTDASRNVIQSTQESGLDNDITAAWMKKTYGTSDAALVSAEDDRRNCACVGSTDSACEGAGACTSPIQLDHCAIPAIPAD